MSALRLRAAGHAGDGGGMPGPEHAVFDHARTCRTGLWVLLLVITSLFFLFLIAFIARAQLPDWQALNGPGAPLADPWRLWLNTSMLVCASLSLHLSLLGARHGYTRICVRGFLLGGLFATGFIAGQLAVWQGFADTGFPVHGNPANSFFYLLTGLHGLHLVGGLVAWSIIARRLIAAGDLSALQPLAIELCARYWHFLLGLWLLLFLVLTRSPETYHAIAAFCGLR